MGYINKYSGVFKELFHCQFMREATKKEREEIEMIEKNPEDCKKSVSKKVKKQEKAFQKKTQ